MPSSHLDNPCRCQHLGTSLLRPRRLARRSLHPRVRLQNRPERPRSPGRAHPSRADPLRFESTCRLPRRRVVPLRRHHTRTRRQSPRRALSRATCGRRLEVVHPPSVTVGGDEQITRFCRWPSSPDRRTRLRRGARQIRRSRLCRGREIGGARPAKVWVWPSGSRCGARRLVA